MAKGVKKSRKKFFTVLDKRKQKHGFFPRTEAGREDAEKFIRKITRISGTSRKEDYVIE